MSLREEQVCRDGVGMEWDGVTFPPLVATPAGQTLGWRIRDQQDTYLLQGSLVGRQRSKQTMARGSEAAPWRRKRLQLNPKE